MMHRLAATLSVALLTAAATAQASTDTAPSAAAAAERLMRAVERVESAASSLAASKRDDAATASRREPPARANGAAVDKAAEERIARIERQLEDQRAANAKALHALQQELDALRESTTARIAAAEQERDAALRRQQQFANERRDLLDAVRAQRRAVDAMVRELKARLGRRDGESRRDAATPRQ